jgi:hypothetical protein
MGWVTDSTYSMHVCVVSVRLYHSLHRYPVRREGETLTVRKYYFTLVWMIIHAYFAAFSCYDSCTERTTRVILRISLKKQRLSHQCRVLQGQKKLDRSLTFELKHVI